MSHGLACLKLTASNTRCWIATDASIKNSIRDLVAELVGVALVDRLGGEEEGGHGGGCCG